MSADRDSRSSTGEENAVARDSHDGGPVMEEAERKRVLYEWNDTAAPYPTDCCLHHLVERQAALTPDAVAVVFGHQRMTFGELERGADRIAQRLLALGVGPETMVGLCTNRTPDMIVGLLGILKAGGAYVALDPTYPRVRLAFMIEDAAMAVLLTQRELVEDLPVSDAKIVCLEDESGPAGQPEERLATGPSSPRDLAYVLYTSGSTGRPKGVAIEHRSVVAFLSWAQSVFPPAELAGVLAATSICFDLSVFEIFLPLSRGGTVILAENALALPTLEARDEITLINTVPSALTALMNVGALPRSVRVVNLAGEPLPNRLVQEVYQLGFVQKVYNLYGPSEDTTYSTFVLTENGATTQPTIGRPISNTQAYVLDEHLQPLPIGAPGELCLGGDGLARGYLNRPEMTAEKFPPNPFGEGRIYRTGDLARFLPDGAIEFLGRFDDQVKIRGHRIELGEIEASLELHPSVERAVVLAVPDKHGEKQLIAYLVVASAPSPQTPVDDIVPADDAPEHVALWRSVYEETYRKGSGAADPTLNTTGWVSSFTGRPIPAVEMLSWVEHTVACILALEPEDVLEIGCGTGMLLARVAPRCTSYVGIDFSPAALDHVRSMQQSVDGLGHIQLLERNADDLGDFAPGSFDTVVINSVVQHFPDVEYLVRVLNRALQLVRPGGHVLVGDVINLALIEAFHTSVQLHRAAAGDTCERVRQRIRRRVAHERDLLLDPAFFVALARAHPEITHVQIRPKLGRHENQLTRFRYEAILHVGVPVARAEGLSWVDWGHEHLTLDELRSRLATTGPATLAIRGIPNARLQEDEVALAWLEVAGDDETISQLRAQLAHQPPTGIEPDDLVALAETCGYHVELSWLNAGAKGLLDAVFTSVDQAHLVADFGAVRPQGRPWQDYANRPQRTRLTRQLTQELRESLAGSLPGYMVPAMITVLERLPLSPNGKIDRRTLEQLPLEAERPVDDEFRAANTPLEELLVDLWADLMNLKQVGVEDDFFALGGNSLQALVFVAGLQKRLNRDIQALALFDKPTISGFASYLEEIYPGVRTDLAVATAMGSDREEGAI